MSAHFLRPSAEQRFAWAFHAVGIGASTLVYHSYRSEVEVLSSPTDYYVLNLLLRGGLEISSGIGTVRLTAAGSACVLSPTERLRMRYSPGTQQFFVKVPIPVIEQAFGRLTGEGGGGKIVFSLPAPANAGWPAALQLAVRTIDAIDSGLPPPPQLGDELERMLISSLLLAHPHSASELMAQPSAGRAARAVAVIAGAIKAAPERSVDFVELARVQGISPRTLQDGFSHRYGRSPSRFLRDARLDMAHQILTQNPHTSVTEVALSSGFSHLGRFARDYRLRYGVSPSITRAVAQAGSVPAEPLRRP
ncbi:AraC family transcriptional regulator [Rhodococcus wratislaviensis]|uniref:AraC family transcriptional regulator n=1 Tax=Rhodococcus wratislaviensis TaxID=44752 RepID=UPI0036513451